MGYGSECSRITGEWGEMRFPLELAGGLERLGDGWRSRGGLGGRCFAPESQ